MGKRAALPDRAPRADARRNNKRLLEVAHKVFTEKGPEVPMEEIARRAKLGIGTLYRHFPTRYDLMEGVYEEQVEALIERAAVLGMSLPPGEALFAWLRAEAEHFVNYRALKVCLLGRPEGSSPGKNWKERLVEAGAPLLDAAVKAGVVREGLDGTDLLRLVHAVTLATEKAPDSAKQARRLLSVMMDGLRATSEGG